MTLLSIASHKFPPTNSHTAQIWTKQLTHFEKDSLYSGKSEIFCKDD